MSFEPITTIGRSHATVAPLRYRIINSGGETRLAIWAAESLLSQVRGQPKYWRLDIDLESAKGRLTGLVQNDCHPATRTGGVGNRKSASRRFVWRAEDRTLSRFPTAKAPQPLTGVEVTSMGIEFKLPIP